MMRLLWVLFVAIVVVASDGFKIPKFPKVEPQNHDHIAPSAISRVITQSSPFQLCLNALISGSQELPTPMCKVWALELIRNRYNFEETRMEPPQSNEDQHSSRNMQELRVSLTSNNKTKTFCMKILFNSAKIMLT